MILLRMKLFRAIFCQGAAEIMDGVRTLAKSVTMAPHLKFALGPMNSLNGPAYLSIL